MIGQGTPSDKQPRKSIHHQDIPWEDQNQNAQLNCKNYFRKSLESPNKRKLGTPKVNSRRSS